MRFLPLLCLFPALAPASAMCTELTVRVGMIEERYSPVLIAPGDQLTTTVPGAAPGSCLLFRMLIPDDREGHSYDFEILTGGDVLHKRSGITSGVGPRSFFVPWPAADTTSPSATFVLRNQAAETLWVESIRFLPDFDAWMSMPPAPDDFTLSLKLSNQEQEQDDMLRDVAKLETAPGVRKAIGAQIHYAGGRRENMAGKLVRLKARSESSGLPIVAVVCSWWAGTPPEVFERLDFQQICWSETDTLDEGPELRRLLGKRWDIRYGLTTPNRWSSVPWQTMNNPELNALRASRMSECMAMTERELKGRVAAYVIENEPMYWADQPSNDRYPMERRNLQADFNPHTVEAAERDGVCLDPKDGLDMAERTWLHGNLARYMQAAVDSATSAGVAGPVYSHMLLSQKFPMAGTGHYRPYAETARVRGARVGLETLRRTEQDALWRVREWGRWGNVNREEGDGYTMPFHVAMLQMQYMMGADLFNSYNWAKVNEGGQAVAYFNEFLSSVAGGDGTAVAGERISGAKYGNLPTGETTWPLTVRPEFPWANGIDLLLRPDSKTTLPLHLWLSSETTGSVIAYRRILPSEIDAITFTRVRFGDVTQCRQEHSSVTLHLKSPGGWMIGCGEDGPDYRLLCELRPERRRSQSIIER